MTKGWQIKVEGMNTSSVRAQGLKTLCMGAAMSAGFGAFAYLLKIHNQSILGIGWAVPGGIALSGLVQLVSGVPFSELSTKWDQLQGWQRGVLGTLIFLVSCVVIFGVFGLVAITFFS
ncbi:hypothetical protein [Piscinibacter terrae]|uniref:Uncharacterized protein n=1 Tax=Piscinibacter terrae TaxID=2496871 RepID=A0A3N7JWI1_9BURK|nr:hypothetical protein [Albitalea terrae]RQP25209.1 hypothetical protein DZC73_10235 [Albitalea terrae]